VNAYQIAEWRNRPLEHVIAGIEAALKETGAIERLNSNAIEAKEHHKLGKELEAV
jgi:hypothetical protein